MKIQDILHGKGHDVVTISEDRTVCEAVKILVEHNIGSVVVVDDLRPIGILTERDILRVTATAGGDLESIRVRSVMTREIITATPEDRLPAAMQIMTHRKIRHLPVIVGERLVGIVSIGEEEPRYASISRMNPDGTDAEVFASGIRNSVGFDWHPETDELWFTSNGRDG